MKALIKLFAFAAALASGCMLASCNDLDELEDRVDSVESRVTALENQIKGINDNITALQNLAQGSTIYSVTEKDGVYTVVLSNGQTLTINQGNIASGKTPIMSIDSDGYWKVDYQDGKGAQFVLSNGQKVKATGSDGVTPQFGVDANNYWTVSYDGGKTFTQVKDANGNPVKATPEGEASDTYFKSVTYADGYLTIVMKDEAATEIKVPVITSFLCSISASGTQSFTYGETKTFAVEMKGVSAATIVTKPEGWSATLSDTELSVTAPAAVSTKAVLADTKTDITVLAVSAQGYSTLATVKVEVSETPVVVNPSATVTAGEATASTLAFTVALTDATSYKYLCLKSSETAPTADEVSTKGTEVTAAGELTLTELEAETEYTLYVVAVNGSTLSEVVTCKGTTLADTPKVDQNDLWAMFDGGYDVTIAGKTYNKTTSTGTLLTASAADTDCRTPIHQKAGIVFLEETADGAYFVTSAVTEITGDVVITSRYADKKATYKPAMNLKLKSGSLVLNNIILNMVEIDKKDNNDSYLFNNANATADFTLLSINGCKFTNILMPVAYFNVATYGFKEISVTGSDFQISATANLIMFNLYKSTVLDRYEKLTFDNNTVYSAAATTVQIFNYDQTVAQSGTTWNCQMSFCGNTLYNVPSANGYLKFYQLASLKINKNIFWADPTYDKASYCFLTYSSSQDGSGFDTTDNIAYGLTSTKNWTIGHSNSTFVPAVNKVDKLSDTPFSAADTTTGVFTPTSAYAAYGAQR